VTASIDVRVGGCPRRPLTPAAIDALVRVVGVEHVVVDPAALSEAETATFATSQEVRAIVRPRDAAQVQACLKVANEEGLALYPISRGKNWGLGSRVPVQSGCVVLDLGRMDRIVDYDPEMAFVTVEPGVTQRQLADFLRAQGGRHLFACTGAPPDSSIVGNTLERGDGVGPLGDRAAHVCALEIVLATGDIVKSGFARHASAKCSNLHRWGVGPSIDGLFSQSNLGIVTRLTMWLTPTPNVMLSLRLAITDQGRLGSLIDGLRALRLEGTLTSVCALWNEYRVLSARGQFPWEAAAHRTPLGPDGVALLRPAAAWFGIAAIYAPSLAQADAAQQRIVEVLAERVDSLGFQLEVRGSGVVVHTVVKGDDSALAVFGSAEAALAVLSGAPQEASLASAYWRKKSPVPPGTRDLDRDRCGFLWSCPAIPLRGEDAMLATSTCHRTMLAHGFEPMLALLPQHDRTAYLVPVISYDRDIPGEDGRALACHDALLAALIAEGYFPYRLGVQSMNALPPPDDDSLLLHDRLKRALDPNGVLAPGRYDFRRSKMH
jgi:4-cresol dehydrogenase (hydroxylating)